CPSCRSGVSRACSVAEEGKERRQPHTRAIPHRDRGESRRLSILQLPRAYRKPGDRLPILRGPAAPARTANHELPTFNGTAPADPSIGPTGAFLSTERMAEVNDVPTFRSGALAATPSRVLEDQALTQLHIARTDRIPQPVGVGPGHPVCRGRRARHAGDPLRTMRC